jgi:hypothetical protein
MVNTKVSPNANTFLGVHPTPDSFGCFTVSNDTYTNSQAPHRELRLPNSNLPNTITQLRKALICHHGSPEMHARVQEQKDAIQKMGYHVSAPHRFPIALNTQKGNLAEVFLAEYIVTNQNASLPVYRLRYNPNVEQSMKGDDVLAFDFSSNPPRILVGEAKFRTTPSRQAVTDIIDGLLRSHQSQIPVSLQFVADRLFDLGKRDLGQRVEDCVNAIAQGKLRLQYVGLLMSNNDAACSINAHTTNELHNLVMISLGMDAPDGLIADCYKDIEEESVNGDSC